QDQFGWHQLHHSEQDLLKRLPSLTPLERERYLTKIRNTPAGTLVSSRYRELLLLGLYDEDAWMRAADEVGKSGSVASSLEFYLPRLSARMPRSVREKVLSSIGASYSKLSKERPRAGNLAPKRLADYFFKHLFRGDSLIEAEIQK